MLLKALLANMHVGIRERRPLSAAKTESPNVRICSLACLRTRTCKQLTTDAFLIRPVLLSADAFAI